MKAGHLLRSIMKSRDIT